MTIFWDVIYSEQGALNSSATSKNFGQTTVSHISEKGIFKQAWN